MTDKVTITYKKEEISTALELLSEAKEELKEVENNIQDILKTITETKGFSMIEVKDRNLDTYILQKMVSTLQEEVELTNDLLVDASTNIESYAKPESPETQKESSSSEAEKLENPITGMTSPQKLKNGTNIAAIGGLIGATIAGAISEIGKEKEEN